MYTEGKPFFVIAGNYQEFMTYSIKKANDFIKQGIRVRIRDFICVHDINYILGYKDVHGVFVGTWKQREDIKLVIQQMMSINKEQLPKEIMNYYGILENNK